MSQTLDITRATDEALVQLLWEMLVNLARDCNQPAPACQDVDLGMEANQQLTDLIARATGAQDVKVFQGIVELPTDVAKVVHTHLGSGRFDTWPERNQRRIITMRLELIQLQKRMVHHGLNLTSVAP